MAKIEVTIDDDHIEAISQGNGLEVLLKQVLEEVLEAEITDHLWAAKHERTDERLGISSGAVRRADPAAATMRVGSRA